MAITNQDITHYNQICLLNSGLAILVRLTSEDQSWLLDVVDCRLNGEFNYSQAAMMVKVAVSCVEEERTRRPSMSNVVENLLSVIE